MSAGITNSHAGKRILVVEDEVLICLLIEAVLTDADYDVIIANSLPEAFQIIDRGGVDAALLDLNVKGKKIHPVAERLAAAGIPFIFASGGGWAEIDGFGDRPRIGKPFQENELLNAVAKLFSGD